MWSLCTLCLRRFRDSGDGSGTLKKSKEACQSGRMGLTANELSPSKGTGGSNPLASAMDMMDITEDGRP